LVKRTSALRTKDASVYPARLIEKHLPKERRARSTSGHVATVLEAAARGDDPRAAAAALLLVLAIERVPVGRAEKRYSSVPGIGLSLSP
jgi:hypothetical protein